MQQGASRRLQALRRAHRRHCEVAGGDGLVYAPPVAHVRGVRHLINGVDNASIQKSAVPASAIDCHKCLVITFTYFLEVYIKVHFSNATVSVWWWRTGKSMFSAAYLTTGNALNRREGKRVKFIRTPSPADMKFPKSRTTGGGEGV